MLLSEINKVIFTKKKTLNCMYAQIHHCTYMYYTPSRKVFMYVDIHLCSYKIRVLKFSSGKPPLRLIDYKKSKLHPPLCQGLSVYAKISTKNISFEEFKYSSSSRFQPKSCFVIRSLCNFKLKNK